MRHLFTLDYWLLRRVCGTSGGILKIEDEFLQELSQLDLFLAFDLVNDSHQLGLNGLQVIFVLLEALNKVVDVDVVIVLLGGNVLHDSRSHLHRVRYPAHVLFHLFDGWKRRSPIMIGGRPIKLLLLLLLLLLLSHDQSRVLRDSANELWLWLGLLNLLTVGERWLVLLLFLLFDVVERRLLLLLHLLWLAIFV